MKVLVVFLALVFLAIPTLTRSDSEKTADVTNMERKLHHIESNAALAHPDPKPTQMTEGEINSYFAAGKFPLPAGVRSVRLSGEGGVITARARVNFDQIKTGRQSSSPLLSIFSGEHDIEAEAHAHGSGGTGFVNIDSVALDGVEIPRFVLQLFVEKYLQPKHPEIGLNSRFRLPDKIDAAAVGKHQLTVTQK
jgi:hypothetical protein